MSLALTFHSSTAPASDAPRYGQSSLFVTYLLTYLPTYWAAMRRELCVLRCVVLAIRCSVCDSGKGDDNCVSRPPTAKLCPASYDYCIAVAKYTNDGKCFIMQLSLTNLSSAAVQAPHAAGLGRSPGPRRGSICGMKVFLRSAWLYRRQPVMAVENVSLVIGSSAPRSFINYLHCGSK